MRKQALTLPGRPGQSVFCDGTGLRELLTEMAKGMAVQSLALYCAAGAGVGKMTSPAVRACRKHFVIRGRLTCEPDKPAKTFRCFLNGHVPKHQELTTISGVKVTF